MPLTEEQRLRFARHLLLPEIGLQGQARLCRVHAAFAEDTDETARGVAAAYLERSGLRIAPGHGTALQEDDGEVVAVPQGTQLSPDRVVALAGPAYLREAAAAVAGAFVAVETIKTVMGVGVPAALPADFSLVEDGDV